MYKKNRILRNYVVLTGRVGKCNELKYYKDDFAICTINLGVKKSYDQYNNFFVKFFDTEESKTAQKVNEEVTEGDYIQIMGTAQVNRYKPKGMDKEVSQIEIVANSFCKVHYNPVTGDLELDVRKDKRSNDGCSRTERKNIRNR
jgi:single-stranded DNA-binding protein